MNRRTFISRATVAMMATPMAMTATPSIGMAMMATPFEASRPKFGAAPLDSSDTPFLSWVNYQGEGQEVLALCYPLDRIVHAFCYVLTDGRTVFAEGTRVNDGSGWRLQEPGEFDGRVIGRVVNIHLQRGKNWTQAGSGWLCG